MSQDSSVSLYVCTLCAYLWFNGVTISRRECFAVIVHDRVSVIINSKCKRFSKLVEVVHLVFMNICIDYLNIIIPIRTNLFMMESKSVDKLVDNCIFTPASSSCNNEKYPTRPALGTQSNNAHSFLSLMMKAFWRSFLGRNELCLFCIFFFFWNEDHSTLYESWDIQLTFETLINAYRFKA